MKIATCLLLLGKIVLVVFTVAILFIYPSYTFAAFTITNLSTTTVNSIDDTITVSASASGLQNSTQYLQVLFTKEGTTNYFGFTKNLKDEWYQYKSSPSIGDLNSYFYAFTPVGGAWVGDIQAKVDNNDSSYKGSGTYTIKLAKYISGSPSYATNTMTVTINIAFTPTPTLSPTLTDIPTPTKVPTPTKTSTPSPTEKTSLSPTIKQSLVPTKVLGVSTKSAILILPTITSTKKQKPKVAVEGIQSQQNFLPFFFIGGGVLLIISCGILTFQTKLKGLWKRE